MRAACQKDKLKFRPNDSSIHPSTAYQPVHFYIHLNWFDNLINKVMIIKIGKILIITILVMIVIVMIINLNNNDNNINNYNNNNNKYNLLQLNLY